MAILETYFFHNTISKYTAAFATVFNDIKIVSNGKNVKVPIAFEAKDKQLVRKTENDDPNAKRIKMQLPRMTFNLTSIEKDKTRSLNKRQKLTDTAFNATTDTSVSSQYMRVPYSFGYSLNIKTKHITELLQIIEQIVVYFDDDLQVVINDNEDLNSSTALSIKLNTTNLETLYDESFETSRQVETTLSFTLDGYLYKPTSTTGTISTVTINYRDIDTETLLESDVITG